jgi:multiple antibiotic resistance protein
MEPLLKSFISLFVAIDALGGLPLLMGLTKDLPAWQKRRLILKASLAAWCIGCIFLFGGKSIFSFLGILENDFRVAGGLLLIVFAIRDLMVTSSHQGAPAPHRVGIVPIAVPLIVGPAALATILLSAEQFGTGVTILSLTANSLFALGVFLFGDRFFRLLGEDLSDTVAKISSLLLAAIGVMLVRSGIQGML